MEAIDYLRKNQKKLGYKPRSFDDITKHRRGQIDNFEEISKRVWNSYQLSTLEGQEDFLRQKLITPFLNAISSNARKRLENIYVGLLPTYDPNACVISVPGNGPLVVLHTELIAAVGFYNEWQFIAARILDKKWELGERFVNVGNILILDCFKEKKPNRFPLLPPILSEQEFFLVQAKALTHELFIIAHEFAHIYLDHLSSSYKKPMAVEDKVSDIPVFNKAQKMEFAADVLATEWLVSLKEIDQISSVLQMAQTSVAMAIEVFMMIHLVELNLGVPDENSSHPSALYRMKHILKQCGSILTADENEFIEGMIQEASYIDSFRVKGDLSDYNEIVKAAVDALGN